MIKYILISDKPLDFLKVDPELLVINATDFISNKAPIDLRKKSLIKVINLCSSFEYLSKGYYCSLLAEARGMRCVPSVTNIVKLNWKRLYQSVLPELNTILDKTYKELADEPSTRCYTLYFGRCKDSQLDALGRRIFDLFRFPLMQVEIKLDAKGKWIVSSIEALSIAELPPTKHTAFAESLATFTGSTWRTKEDKKEKYWIGMLHDPEEKQPPSNKSAIQKFIRIGKELNVSVELITKHDYASLLEYDALFIRETTAINHHTFRFSLKAEEEGIPCMDDSESIIRCCNKVFQYEILDANKIPLPKTTIIDRKNIKKMADVVSYPCVVKIPDGAFSKGVSKAESPETFIIAVTNLLKKSEIVLAQEFVHSDFDWRVGFLNGQPLFACKYFMSKGHWQIYNHNPKTGKIKDGKHQTISVEEVPPHVMSVAHDAAKLMGNGLYGVDLKETADKGVVVMEVNDNPNIDAGVEDQYLGDALYKIILNDFIRRIEAR